MVYDLRKINDLVQTPPMTVPNPYTALASLTPLNSHRLKSAQAEKCQDQHLVVRVQNHQTDQLLITCLFLLFYHPSSISFNTGAEAK